MEAGLDNANNPFTNSNGSLKNLDVETDNIHLQKSGDGLLLNLTDNFKANGTELSQDIFEKSNGTKKSSSDIHFDDGFGPETDVDAVDDAFSPVEKSKTYAECLSKSFNDEGLPKSFNDEVKAFSDGLANNNPLGNNFNPFLNKEIEDKSEKDRKEDDFEEHGGDNREETPTPPVDTLHDAGGLEENPAESDSEDEWNYYKGDQAKPETLSLQPETVVETSELEDAMSQLNPNAAEFVPVSPTRSIPSPASRALLNDEVISQSPKRPVAMNIRVPNETEFEKEVKSRPSDFDTYSNGHDSDSAHNISGIEQIENILNGKSVDEIPEFQPGSTPSKQAAEEFHFGPNAAPFTPRLLDQSEALSTKANFGDDTEQTLNTSFNDSDLAIPFKDVGDPMSLSFSATRGDTNPFQDNDDLNKVHDLPDDIDEFLQDIDDNKENIKILDDTISDLPEHDVLGHLDNDRAAVQTTDLDKMSQDDEKELASPLEQDDVQALLGDLNAPLKSFESTLPKDFVVVAEKRTTDDSNISSLPELEPIEPIQDVLLIPEPQLEVADSRVSPLPTQSDLQEAETLSPVPDEVSDLSISPIPEAAELLESKTPVPIEEQETMQQPELGESRLSPLTVQPDLQEAKPLSPSPDLFQPKSEISEEAELLQAESPIYIDDANKLQQELSDLRLSPLSGHHEEALSIILESKSPVSEVADLLQSKSPVPAEQQSIKETDGSGGLESQGPACGLMSEPRLPLVDDFEGSTSVCEFRPTSDMLETEFNPKSEVENLELEAKSPGLPEELAVSPIPEVACHLAQHIYVLPESHSPFDSQHEKQEEEVTSSIKDDISSPIELLSPVKSPEVLLEDSFNEEDIKRAEPEAVIIDDSFSEIAQEVPKTDAPPQEVPSRDLLGDLMCPLPSLRPHVETEPPVPKNVFSMFKASAPFEPSSFAELSDGLNNFASDFSEQFSIKTDNIKPEFAEPAVITPSEDSKVIDEVPLAFLGEVPVQAPPQIVETSQEAPKELPVLAPLPIVPVEVKEVQKEIKKSGTASPPKKPIGKVGSSKSITAAKAPATTKATARPAASSSRTAVAAKVPSKTGPPKHTPTATRTTTSTIAATKLSPKPKTPAAPRPIEKKPLTNGDVKPAPRTTLTKRPASSGEVTATKTTTRTAAVAPIAKTSPSKMTAARPLTAPRAAPPKTASTNAGAPKPPASTTMAPKPRVPLASRTTTTGTATARLVSSTTTAKTPTATTNRTSLSPKTSTAPPKPKTLTYATPKPRMPLTKTITKSADVEKEKKESANKLTASRVTTVTKTTSGTATSRTATTTLKKTETKPLSNRTALSKTSTTTRTTTVSKKPGEIKSVTKTKTTKVEKPKENGVAPTSITEEIKEITIVNNVVNETENLIKDNSPLDNKLITETSNALIDINPAD